MWRFANSLVIALVISCCSVPGNSQIEILHEKPFKAQSLSGVVRLGPPPGVVADGVLVEECSSDWKTVMASTRTDGNGHFSLANSKSKGLHYLRLSGHDLQRTCVKVRISKLAHKKELILTIYDAM